MTDTDDGWKTDKPLLIYGKIFSHRGGTCFKSFDSDSINF